MLESTGRLGRELWFQSAPPRGQAVLVFQDETVCRRKFLINSTRPSQQSWYAFKQSNWWAPHKYYTTSKTNRYFRLLVKLSADDLGFTWSASSFESKNALQVHACYLLHSRLRQLFKYVMHFLVLLYRDKTLNASVATDDFSFTTKRWSKLKSWADLPTFVFFCAWMQVLGISLAFPFLHRIFARPRPKPVKCAVTPCIPTSCSPLCDNILGNVNGSTDYVVSFWPMLWKTIHLACFCWLGNS